MDSASPTEPGHDSTAPEDTEPGTETGDLERRYDGLEFTMYLRPPSSQAVERRQHRIVDRFDALADDGVLPVHAVERWRTEIRVHDDGAVPDEWAVALYDEFSERAAVADARLEPFFDEREDAGSFLAGRRVARTIVFPVVCVSVRRDERLVGLYPCWRNGTHHSVGTCLDRLEARQEVTNLL